jgi:hypothetical protein
MTGHKVHYIDSRINFSLRFMRLEMTDPIASIPYAQIRVSIDQARK